MHMKIFPKELGTFLMGARDQGLNHVLCHINAYTASSPAPASPRISEQCKMLVMQDVGDAICLTHQHLYRWYPL